MPLVPLNALGQVGIITDMLPHELPLNAWSSGRNIRFRDAMVEKFLGHSSPFGAPTVAPYFAMPITIGGTRFWVAPGLQKIYTWDGSTFTNITRQTASVDVNYTGTVLSGWMGVSLGGIAILNNGTDVPQSWVPNVANKCQNLANWNSNHVAAAMRVFRRHLIAMNVTKTGVASPQMVKWSHPGSAGAVPTSWDETDATKDAGEYEILDTNGACVDGVRLRDNFVIYKEDSAHWMQYIGGTDIFRFAPMFDSFGILSRKCAVEYSKGRHAVFAVGDIISHDGQNWESIVGHRMRNWLFNQIDQDNYLTSFVAWNPAKYEVWFCFPVAGSGVQVPTQALVWNYKENTLGVRDLPGVAYIATGGISLASSGNIWDNDTSAWDSDVTVWDSGVSNVAGLRLLAADPTNTQLWQMDTTPQFNGASFQSYVERLALPLPVSPDGPPDMRSRKFIRDLFPRIEGTPGGVVKVHIGKQEVVGGSVTWLPARNYVIGSTRHIDVRVNTVLPAFRFESTDNIEWRLAGMEVDVVKAGNW